MPGRSILSLVRMLFAAVPIVGTVPDAMAVDPPPRTIAPPTRIPDPLPVAGPAGEPVSTSAMPEAVRRAVVADAATRFNVSPNDVVLTRAEQVTWPDGSLGCPRPGRVYTQMLVPGFRVVAKTTAGELLYHTDGRGNAVNCASPYTLGPRSLEKSVKPDKVAPQPAIPAS